MTDKGGKFNAIIIFFLFFNLPPFQGSESLGLHTWFVSSMGLLLHRSNRTLSKPPVPSSETPKRGIKQQFSNTINVGTRGWGLGFAVNGGRMFMPGLKFIAAMVPEI